MAVEGKTLYRFSASFSEQVILEDEIGWISIYVPSDSACRFSWCNSPVGDDLAAIHNAETETFEMLTDDLSICLLPGLGGEGEEMPTLEDAELLQNSFNAADLDSNGRLSFAEASMVLGTLTMAQFNTLDTNGDNELSGQELQQYIDDNTPAPPGCFGAKAYVQRSIEKLRSDLLVALLALGTLGAITRLRYRK
ncbi:MAG: hypothetical protein HYV27_06825 [Candidatus Hydrogenedentes bacterium]|nr:hypothetical protein [Candidatus Hydrogenedentota bacterium]